MLIVVYDELTEILKVAVQSIILNKELGYSEMSLGVDIDNINARHLYEKKGFNNVIFEGEDEYGKYVKLLKNL